MEDVQQQLQSHLPSIKSRISGLSDFSENVNDLSDFSPHISISYTIHISVAPDFITHDSHFLHPGMTVSALQPSAFTYTITVI